MRNWKIPLLICFGGNIVLGTINLLAAVTGGSVLNIIAGLAGMAGATLCGAVLLTTRRR